MEKIRNLSLKHAIIFYMIIGLFCSFIVSAIVVQIATKTQEEIWNKYIDEEDYMEAIQGSNKYNKVAIPRPSRYDMTRIDGQISELCDFLQTYGALCISIAGSCIAVALFYKNKLKTPIEELSKASNLIAKDNLDFHILYKNQDELGRLCKEFEKMRAQLEENNRKLWHMVEDEKALRAAIAHDIRSPLSVLQGYQEMLLEFVPKGTFDKEKIVELLLEGMYQIKRMNHFIETMRKMTKLEERELQYKDVNVIELGKRIENAGNMIVNGTGKVFEVKIQSKEEIINIDIEIVLEVVDNLLSNAIRYAKEKIKIILSLTELELIIIVIDDGIGFTETAEKITKAFYHSNPQDDLKHFGMGMYISRIYCERHGGRLLIGNYKSEGALVEAVFKLNK